MTRILVVAGIAAALVVAALAYFWREFPAVFAFGCVFGWWC